MPGLFDSVTPFLSGLRGGVLGSIGSGLANAQNTNTLDEQLGPGAGSLMLRNPGASQMLYNRQITADTYQRLLGGGMDPAKAFVLATHPEALSEQGKPINVPPGGSVVTPLFGMMGGGQGPQSPQQQPPSSQPAGGGSQQGSVPGAQFTNGSAIIPDDQADMAAERTIIGDPNAIPSGFGSNSPLAIQNRNIVMGKVLQKMQERGLTWQNIASNKMKYEGLSKNMGDIQKTNNALNTGIGHLAQLGEVFQNLGNQSFQPSNYVKNLVGEILGSANPTNYKAVAARVAPEITRIWRGAGGAESDITRDLKTLSEANSPEQGFGAISNIAKLMGSKLEANRYQFESVFGPGTAKFMMSPESEAGMAKLQQQAGGTAVAPPQTAIAHLKANPNLRAQFDAKYGAGSAAKVLGNAKSF